MQKLFPTIARMPYCLYIPSNSFQIEIKMEKCYGVRQALNRKILSNLCVLQWALLLVLCLCLQHLKIRQCPLTFLSSFCYSTFTLVFGMLTILIFMKWETIYNTCSKKIVKYSHTLNSLLEMIFTPSVAIIRLVLHFLEPLYKSCLQIKSKSRFSLVHYFWSLASKIFLFLVMVTCLLLYYSILLNLSPTRTLGVGHSVPFYLAATVLILTLSALPCGFLAVSYLVISTTVGNSFDANSVYPTDLPLLFPSLNIFFCMLLTGYPCIKLVEFHHPGFCFGMVFRSKRFVTSILVIDVTGKSHSFTFAPHGMVFDLKSHINSKFNITSDLYWLSNKGKPLQHDFVPLQEISAGQCYNE